MTSSSRKLTAALGTATLITLTGCVATTVNGYGVSSGTPATKTAVVSQGNVRSGQSAVSGASINLYSVSTSGYGNTSTSLLQAPVTTGADGGFTIASDYTCPANALVYIVATGGSIGMAGAQSSNSLSSQSNTALAMMTGLGPCGNVTNATAIQVNELTTVASVWALSGFMSSSSAIGTTPTNIQGLTNAFAAINKIVDISVGTMPGAVLPVGASLPSANINTIANVLATCVNSANASNGTISSNCSTLFADTAIGGNTPADTIQAALNMAQNPTLNVTALNKLANSSSAPYQPSLGANAPTSWQIAINYVGGGLSSPSAIAADTNGNIWIANSGNSSVTELSNSGAAVSGTNGFTAGGINAPTAIALDSNNTAWVANGGNDTLTHLSASGATGASITGGGLSKPSSIAIDQNGDIWAANSGNSSLSEFTPTGTVLSGTSGNTGGGLNHPVAIAIQQ